MASALAVHPFGIRYFLLWLCAWVIRLPTLILAWVSVRKSFRLLRPDVSRVRIQIPSRDKGRTITVDVYEKADQPKDIRRYAHINFHGSGFTIPSLGSDVDFCAQLASTGTVVFDADYRKAPEHPFPAAFQDAQDVLSYLQNHASDFDASHLTVGGFSAGANLAMSLSVNSAPGSVAGVVSIYGNPDMTRIYQAPDPNYDSGVILPEWMRAFFYKALILPGQDRADSRLSPAYAPLERWPKHVFLACGAADSLHDSGKVMISKLGQAAHTDAVFMSVEREAHAFDKGVKKGSPTEQRRDAVYSQAIEMVERTRK